MPDSKSTIDPQVLKIIQVTTEQAVKKAANAIMAANEIVDAEQRNYFRETERLLYSLPALKLSLAEYDEDITADELISARKKSKDIIRRSSGGNALISPEDIIKNRLASVERTRKQIQRIERALETIKEDPYYEILQLKYWDAIPSEDIATNLHCDERTFRRHKNRLINTLKVILFGADAL